MNTELACVCRTCLTSTAKCISIFKEPDLWGKTIPLSKMIMACAPVNISEGDGFPSHICESCLKQLQFSFLFRIRILQSDEQLKECAKRQIKPYLVQQNTESVYSIKEILQSSEHKNTLAIVSSGKPSENKGTTPNINLLPKPIEEVMVPMISDILYEETIDTKVLPSVKNSRLPPKTIYEVDLTDDQTDINITPTAGPSVINETLLAKESENQPNIPNNIIVQPLQITNQVLLPSNYSYCVSETAANTYFVPNNKEQMLQFQQNSNLITLQDSDKSILQNLLQTHNKIDNHYIVIAGNSGGDPYVVSANQIDQSKNEHNFNNQTGGIQFASQINTQHSTPLRCYMSKDTVSNLNQQNSLKQTNNNNTGVQVQSNLKAFENNYYNFLSEREKRKVNDLLTRDTSKRKSVQSNCVDLTSDAEDEFTNNGDSTLKITNVSSQATKKTCLAKK